MSLFTQNIVVSVVIMAAGAVAALGLWELVIAPAMRRLHLDGESRREARPCALCRTLPNTAGHQCTVTAGARKRWHQVSDYYRQNINPYSSRRKSRVPRWHGQLIGPSGHAVLELTTWQQYEGSAIAEARKKLRAIQTGAHSDTARVQRRVIEGSDTQGTSTRRTPRGRVPAGWTPEAWVVLQAAHAWRCAYCGEPATEPEIEHATPLARGGADDMSNIVPACKPCNRDKGRMTSVEYVKWRAQRGLPVRGNA